jgi:hypothetical protein
VGLPTNSWGDGIETSPQQQTHGHAGVRVLRLVQKDAINKAVSKFMMRGEYPEYRAARIPGFSLLQMVV